jgi:hypothetical protein
MSTPIAKQRQLTTAIKRKKREEAARALEEYVKNALRL